MIGKKINQLATELAPASTDLTIIGNPTTGVSKKITLAQLGAIFSGAVSFYTNLASFPATGTLDVIFCAKDTQKLYLWSGSAYVEVFPSQALLDTYQLRSEKGNANGYASLDSSGKVPVSQLPSSIMEYKGTWSAATNTPTLANGTGDTGDVYICNAAGSVNFGAGAITFAVGDYVIYSGSIWQRSSGAVGTVTSVAASITGNAIGITGSPVTTSGTLAFAFAGTGAQYIKGDGTLATFPSTISQAEKLITEVYNSTGATLTKGTVVYINGGQGNLPTVTKALATGDSTSAQTFGIVQADITNNNNGYVVVAGKLNDLDTQAYTEGTQLYLSSTTAGAWTSTKQYAPAHLVYVGIVVRSHPTQGIVEVKIQNGYELDEIHNVAAQTPSNNDGLFWEASTSLWKNKSISTILGGTPITGSGNVNAIPKFTANSVLGNSVMEDDGNFVSMRGLKLNVVAGSGSSINFGQASSISAAGLGYSTIGASGTAGFIFYIDQNTTQRSFIIDVNNINSATTRNYSMPNASGTFALTSDLTGGTVTSVGLSSATSGVTIGSTPITTSGTITLAIATASGSQQGLLSSTDWTTFNNKQNALTNPVTGTGTTNYLPKFTGTSTIGNSIVQDASTYIDVAGYAFFRRGGKYLILNPNVSNANTYADIGVDAGMGITFTPNAGSAAMTLSTSGNLGLGVTPSASNTPTIEVGYVGNALVGRSGIVNLTLNAYRTATWKYANTGAVSNFELYNGGFDWYNAPSGTAGTDIAFGLMMRLNASGNLSIGNTNNTYKLDVSGTGRFNASDSQLTLSHSGGVYSTVLVTNSIGNFYIQPGGSFNALTIASTGAATFSSSVTATQGIFRNSGVPAIQVIRDLNVVSVGTAGQGIEFGALNGSTPTAGAAIYGTLDNPATTGALVFQTLTAGSLTTKLTLASTGAATFSSSVTAGGNITGNGVTIGASDVRSSSNILTLGGTSEVIRIAGSTGSVGIGTTSPTSKLEVKGNIAIQRIDSTTDTGLIFGNEVGTSRAYLNFSATNERLYYKFGTSELFTILQGGNVGIGTTSPTQGKLVVSGGVANSIATIAASISGGSNALNIGDDGTNAVLGVANSGTDMVFLKRVAGVYSEAMRITSGGNVGIGNTDPDSKLKVTSSTNSSWATQIINSGSTDAHGLLVYTGASSTGIPFSVYSQATERMRITSSGEVYIAGTTDQGAYNLQVNGTGVWGAGAYVNGSDRSLKESIYDIDECLELIKQLKPVTYKYKESYSKDNSTQTGFIAQDLKELFKNKSYLNGLVKEGGQHLSVAYQNLIPILVKGIQELKAELDTLKNK